MPAIIVYLLKVNAALCLFYLAHRFALRPLTFYYLNRFFLVFGIIFSTIYPLINFSSLFVQHTAIRQQLVVIVPDWHAVLPAVRHQAAAIDYWGLPVALFWIGVSLMAARLAVQFISLRRIYKDSAEAEHFGQVYRAVRNDVNPFSFWQDIYLNPEKHSVAELTAIIKHEQVHVKQWHTLDVILTELSTVFYWFNPGVWFMRQAVKENLEFITDREILRSGVDEKAYQYSLVRVSALKPGAAIVNNFNFLTIKKRIIMMNKKRSSKAQITKYVILLPLVMLLALVFTASKAELSTKKIAVLMKKILPANTLNKPNTQSTSASTPKKDTVKLKLKKDTAIRLVVFEKDSTHDTTVVLTNGKKAPTLKNIKIVRINGKDEDIANDKNVIILNDKGEKQHMTLAEITPDAIDTIRLQDSVKAITGLQSNTKTLVIKLKPLVIARPGTSTSTFSVATPQTVSVTTSSRQAVFSVDVRNHNDEVVYVIDPKNITAENINNMRKLFKQYNFDLTVRTDYKGDVLKGLDVKISSEGRKNSSISASSSYNNENMGKADYLIKVLADKITGAVSITTVNR